MSRICPKCESKDVEPDFSSESFGRGSFFNSFKCNNCDNKGIYFPEVD